MRYLNIVLTFTSRDTFVFTIITVISCVFFAVFVHNIPASAAYQPYAYFQLPPAPAYCDNSTCYPIARFYNKQNGTHVYIEHPSQELGIHGYPIKRPKNMEGYTFEGLLGYAPGAWQDTDPIQGVYTFRFYNLKTGGHFFTRSQSEATYINDNLYRDYRYEGEKWKVFDRTTSGIGLDREYADHTKPVHRFYNLKTGSHFYTLDQGEASYTNDHLYHIYRYEGVLGYLIST